MIIVEASARIPEGTWEQAKPVMEAMILASREEEGCVEYAYSLDIIDNSVMRVIERWKDMDALEFHFATPHMATFRAALAELALIDLSIRMYDAEPQALPI